LFEVGDDDALNDDQQIPPEAEQKIGQEGNHAVADLATAAFDPYLIALRGVQRIAWVRAVAIRLLDRWQAEAPRVTAEGLGLALSAAAHTAEHFRQQQTLELVWTGPDSQVLPLRRTDQALLELINGAQNRLIIISFAVYKATAIASALVQAARRHVAVDVCLETPDASEGKVAYDMLAALGPDVRRHATFYVWPLAQRPLSPTGHHGSLHAKVAVADGGVLLISSANLTEYAMTLNMEMGVLLRDGELPKQVELHFARLIDTGILEPVRFK
jgi:phosphatidylserine/phosphatidylglycerophosphate/cardiolipin synthase-like enzyme